MTAPILTAPKAIDCRDSALAFADFFPPLPCARGEIFAAAAVDL